MVLACFGVVFCFSASAESARGPITKMSQTKNGKQSKWVPGEIIVKFKASARSSCHFYLAQEFGLETRARKSRTIPYYLYWLGDDRKTLDQVIREINENPDVEYAEKNYVTTAMFVPNDTYYLPLQWSLQRIGCGQAWDVADGSNVVVAVLDTGVTYTHEDFLDTQYLPGYDKFNNDNDPADDHGHGSLVCGTIAQSTDNNIGCAGIAYNSEIIPVKVLDADGEGPNTVLAEGIYFAVARGADILNISLGGYDYSMAVKEAVDYAWEHNVLVVCAAGNDTVDSPVYPASYEHAISVSATNYLDELANYSNFGPTIDISAPGGDEFDHNQDGFPDGILQGAVDPGTGVDGYYFSYGTSNACPHVAGVAALIKSVNGDFTNAGIRRILEFTARDLGDPGYDVYFGHGQVSAVNAVNLAENVNDPAANFDFQIRPGGWTVDFNDSSVDNGYSIESWRWDFGDGSGSEERHPTHLFTDPGVHEIKLTVANEYGLSDEFITTATLTEKVTLDEDFEDGASDFTEFDSNNTATMLISSNEGVDGGYCLKVNNSQTATAAWKLYARQTDLSLENEQYYHGSVDLRAENPSDVYLVLHQNYAPFLGFGLNQECEVDAGWRTFPIYFKSINNPEADPSNVRFAIEMGYVQGAIWIDNVRLKQVPAVFPDPVLRNGLFEAYADYPAGWFKHIADPSNSAIDMASGVGVNGSRCAVVENVQPTPHRWNTTLFQTGVDIQDGRQYMVSAFLKTEIPSAVFMSFYKNTSPWTGFGLSRTINTTTDWLKYEYTFTAINHPETDPDDVRFIFELGDVQGKTWIDDVQLIQLPVVLPDPVLRNGSFEAFADYPVGWFKHLADRSNSAIDVVSGVGVDGGQCVVAENTQTAPNRWNTALSQTGADFQDGRQYTVSAYLKSETPSEVVMALLKITSPWAG